jgi:hypothetical protein
MGTISATSGWESTGFGALDPQKVMRVAIPSVTLLTLGVQMGLSSFFLSILWLKRSKNQLELPSLSNDDDQSKSNAA